MNTTTSEPGAAARRPTDLERLRELALRVEAGDDAALPELRRLMDRHPEEWQEVTDLACLAEGLWVRVIAGREPVFRESLRRQVEEYKTGLAGPDATPLERLLAGRVVTAWLAVEYCEVARVPATEAARQAADEADRRLGQAQSRFLAAAKTFALVRRLLRPALAPLDVARAVPRDTAAPRPRTPRREPRGARLGVQN